MANITLAQRRVVKTANAHTQAFSALITTLCLKKQDTAFDHDFGLCTPISSFLLTNSQ